MARRQPWRVRLPRGVGGKKARCPRVGCLTEAPRLVSKGGAREPQADRGILLLPVCACVLWPLLCSTPETFLELLEPGFAPHRHPVAVLSTTVLVFLRFSVAVRVREERIVTLIGCHGVGALEVFASVAAGEVTAIVVVEWRWSIVVSTGEQDAGEEREGGCPQGEPRAPWGAGLCDRVERSCCADGHGRSPR